jgi:cytochrome c oxidase assembly protein subunit 15
MALVGTLVYLTVLAWSPSGAPQVEGLGRRAWLAAGAVLAVVLAGAYVRGQGAGLAFKDWPLMDGRIVPELGSVAQASQFVHRLLAAAAVPLVAWVAVRARRARGQRPAAFGLAVVAAAAIAAQVLVGAANVWSGLAIPAAVAHVVLASIVWAALIGTAAAARPVPERVGA